MRNIAIGDVGLIRDDEQVPRTQWRMGKILRLVKGTDGQVRGAQLKVLSKTGKQTAVFRPLQKVIPFEIGENRSDGEGEIEDTANEGQLDELLEEPEHKEESTSEKITTPDYQESGKRGRRKAAIEGQNIRRLREQYM